VTRRRGRRRKKLLDDLKDRRGYSHLKEEALNRTMWRNRFGTGVGPVVRLLNERHVGGEWRYSYTCSLTLYSMQVITELHAPAVLLPKRQHSLATE
jgi:hypothetical protein